MPKNQNALAVEALAVTVSNRLGRIEDMLLAALAPGAEAFDAEAERAAVEAAEAERIEAAKAAKAAKAEAAKAAKAEGGE